MDVCARRQGCHSWMIAVGGKDTLLIERDVLEEDVFNIKAFGQAGGIPVWLRIQRVLCRQCNVKAIVSAIDARLFDKEHPVDKALLGWIAAVRLGTLELPEEVLDAHPPSSPTRSSNKDKSKNWGCHHA